MEEVNTEFGTRILLIEGTNASVKVEKNEHDIVLLTVQDANMHRTAILLKQEHLLTLIEFFALAAKPGTGKPYVEMPMLEENSDAKT